MNDMDVKDLFKEIKKYEGKDVTLEGWVRNNRNQSNFGFIDFNDGTYFKSLQLVYDKELKDITAKEFLDVVEKHGKDGVD